MSLEGYFLHTLLWEGKDAYVSVSQLWHSLTNLAKKSAHLAWQEVSLLSVFKYWRFLWPMKIRNGCRAPSNQCLHSSRASFRASSSLLPISLFHLVGVSFLEKKAIRCSLGFSLNLWVRMAPSPVWEAATSTMKDFDGPGQVLWSSFYESLQALLSCWVPLQFLWALFKSAVRRLAMELNSLIQKLAKLRNLCSSLTVVETGPSLTAVTLSWSMNTPLAPIIYPRNNILGMWNSHFFTLDVQVIFGEITLIWHGLRGHPGMAIKLGCQLCMLWQSFLTCVWTCHLLGIERDWVHKTACMVLCSTHIDWRRC